MAGALHPKRPERARETCGDELFDPGVSRLICDGRQLINRLRRRQLWLCK